MADSRLQTSLLPVRDLALPRGVTSIEAEEAVASSLFEDVMNIN